MPAGLSLSCPVEVADLADFGVTDPGLTGAIRVELLSAADAIAEWGPGVHLLGDEAVRMRAIVGVHATPEQVEGFCDWARQRLQRLLEHGAEPDGWPVASDGSLQIWAREVWLPHVD